MRNFFRFLLGLLMLFSFDQSALIQRPLIDYDKSSARRITNENLIKNALKANYPLLSDYYEEGVIKVMSVTEVMSSSNHAEYIVKYKYCYKFITDYGEKISVMKDSFPELYKLYCDGKIKVEEIYKYVGSNGKIRYQISYMYL